MPEINATESELGDVFALIAESPEGCPESALPTVSPVLREYHAMRGTRLPRFEYNSPEYVPAFAR